MIGSRESLIVAAIVLTIAVLASPVPFIRDTFGLAYMVLVIPCDLLMLYSVCKGFSNPIVGQSYLTYSIYLAAVVFVVGRATVLIG